MPPTLADARVKLCEFTDRTLAISAEVELTILPQLTASPPSGREITTPPSRSSPMAVPEPYAYDLFKASSDGAVHDQQRAEGPDRPA